jgi:plasmid stabilization system protein ParE
LSEAHIVLYRETPELVEVINVFHARQQWPKENKKQ